jgi:CheY-like chemotaxis protein
MTLQPSSKRDQGALTPPHPAGEKPETLVPLTSNVSLEGVYILLVDDDPNVRAALTRVLEERKAIVQPASSAAEAIAAFKNRKPDLIVSDIGMPEEDGHVLIRKLRELEAASGGRVPAVALTGHGRTEDRFAAMRAGFQIHVSKPVATDEFLTIVATLAGRFD